jgi:hypothetical protein
MNLENAKYLASIKGHVRLYVDSDEKGYIYIAAFADRTYIAQRNPTNPLLVIAETIATAMGDMSPCPVDGFA